MTYLKPIALLGVGGLMCLLFIILGIIACK